MNYQEINKKNLPRWEDTLKYVTEILDRNNIRYYLSASGLEYILGSNIYPYDIDFFMSEESVRKAFPFFKEYKTSDLHYWKEDNREYLEFQGLYNDIPFEICEWREDPRDIEIVEYKGIKIQIIKQH